MWTRNVELKKRYMVLLDQVGLDDTMKVGRKAAFLGELLRAGMLVPTGYVLTVDAQLAVQAAGGAIGEDLDFSAVPLPAELVEALDALAESLGDTAVAVRSSAVDEDLTRSSFAGQYDTVLNVRGRSALEHAVRQCWMSTQSPHVRVYQRASGIEHGAAMAVVVQHMVSAVAAGVTFSANPLTGDRDEVVVNVVRGLGERLVSGQASPDEWTVRDGSASLTAGHEQALDSDRVVEIAGIARGVEKHFGQPQDIEWVFDGSKFWLVQARPITTLRDTPRPSTPIPIEVPPGSWSRDTFARRPWKPLQVSTFQPVLNRTTGGIAAYGMANGLEYRQIGGWPYSQVRTLPPEEFSRRLSRVVEALDRDDHGKTIERWYSQWRDEFTTRIKEFRAMDHATDAELIDWLARMDRLIEELFTVHFTVASAGLYLIGEFGLFCRDELGWPLAQSLRMVAGLPGMTTEPALALSEITTYVRSLPKLRDQVAALEVSCVLDVRATLSAISPELAARFGGYLDQYCHRAMGIDISEPTLAEEPWLVLRLLVDQVKTDGSGREVEACTSTGDRLALVETARRELSDRKDSGVLARFGYLLGRAQRAQTTRDDKAFLIATVRGLFRYLVLEFGRRLADYGVLADREDVFFLAHGELAPALRLRTKFCQDLINHRKFRYNWATTHRGPLRYGDRATNGDGGNPDEHPAWLRQLPQKMQHPMTVLLWIYRTGNTTTTARTDAELTGVAASPGRYTGSVRVIPAEDQLSEVRQGEVLVCPETTPQWSLVFPKVGALVTDTGGLLSHPAIIAREYRIPAVIATQVGTETLRTGQVVTVDGDAGIVKVEDTATGVSPAFP